VTMPDAKVFISFFFFFFFDGSFEAPPNWQKPGAKLPIMGDESIMKEKGHGTCATALQKDLLWGVDAEVADRICTKNRHYAEHSGYFVKTGFIKAVESAPATVK
jgi:hypothetical protein